MAEETEGERGGVGGNEKSSGVNESGSGSEGTTTECREATGWCEGLRSQGAGLS